MERTGSNNIRGACPGYLTQPGRHRNGKEQNGNENHNFEMEENNMDMEYKRIYVVAIRVRHDIKTLEILEKAIHHPPPLHVASVP